MNNTIEAALLKSLEESESELIDNDALAESKVGALSGKSTAEHASENISEHKRISPIPKRKNFTQQELNEKRLVSTEPSASALLNEYRNLRTKLFAANPPTNFVTLVSSIIPEHNTNLISANLAATIANDWGKTSILIDANVKSREMEKLFELNPTFGLIDYLDSDKFIIEQTLYEVPIPDLRYVPSGNIREHYSEYFTNYRMKEFIRKLVIKYPDCYPIIDAPSIASSADTRILIDLCDCVILVIPYGKCSEDDVKQAVNNVDDKKFFGVILDQF